MAQAEKAGAQALVSAMGPDTNLQLWKALQAAGSDLKVITPAGSVSEATVKQAGSAADGSYSVASIPAATADNPTGAAYLKTLKEFGDAKATPDGVGLRAWASVKLSAEVAGTIDGDVDRASVLKAFGAVHDKKFLWVDSLSFDEKGPIAALPRVVSAVTFPQLIKDGTFVAEEPVDPFATVQ
ncbi:MAG: ABC transporter substrate-binding protein [Aeromicrobium sp.]